MRKHFLTASVVVCIALATCTASGKSGASRQRSRGSGSGNRAYKTSIMPHWFADNTRFWYRNNLRSGAREFAATAELLRAILAPLPPWEELAPHARS